MMQGIKIINQSFMIGVVTLIMLISTSIDAQGSRGITLTTQDTAATGAHLSTGSGVYRALIIGNNDYQDKQKKWHSLSTAVSDARAVADILKQQYGFTDIELLQNATRRDVLLALDRLAARAMKNDHVLVYYAGHGFMDEDTRKGFWIPVDANGTDHTTFLRNSTIRDEVSIIASRVKHTLLISDSCFSGSLLRTASRGITAAEYTDRYYKKVSAKKSVQIMAAGGNEFVDDDYNTSGHSPFTYFLLNELKTNNSPMITVSELSSNVQKAVANNVDQVPESGVLQGAGDELGEFIFIKMNVAVEGVNPDKVKVKVNVVPATTPDKPAAGNNNNKSEKLPVKVIPIPTL